ncbi:MAG TPA: hypothetical protein V6D33_02010 [Cyanophyceae cyanobacterium]
MWKLAAPKTLHISSVGKKAAKSSPRLPISQEQVAEKRDSLCA